MSEQIPWDSEASNWPDQIGNGMIPFIASSVHTLRHKIAIAQSTLAELEAAFTSKKASVIALQARLFERLRIHYERRDGLRLLVKYREEVLASLRSKKAEALNDINAKFQRQQEETQKRYDRARRSFEGKRHLSAEDEDELKILWKSLVKLFHPDRYAEDKTKQATYTNLIATINEAKDKGDIDTLRLISKDPLNFILRQGWAAVDLEASQEVDQLEKLLSSLNDEIERMKRTSTELECTSEWELDQKLKSDVNAFDQIVKEQTDTIATEIETMQKLADDLLREIEQTQRETFTATSTETTFNGLPLPGKL